MRGRAAALALALTLGGCVEGPVRDVEPSLLAVAQEDRRWLADWDRVVREVSAGEAPQPLTRVHRGEHLAVHLLGLRPHERLPAPTIERAEVLIVVEGGGTVTVAGRAQPVQFGDVLVLPAGSRGVARGGPRLPLLGLLLRATAPPPPAGGGEPRLLTFDDLFPRADDHSAERVIRHTLASLPGQLSVHSLTIKWGQVPRHLHYDHDEFLMIVNGFGTLGWGDEAGDAAIARGFVSASLASKGLVYIPTRVPHSYVDEANPTRALSIFGPDLPDQTPRDYYLVPDHDAAKQGAPPDLRPDRVEGVESAEPPPPGPARRVRWADGEGG